MAPVTGINLIRTKTSISPQLTAIEQSLRRSAYIAIGVFLCAGIVVAVVYVLFSQERTDLQNRQQSLIQQVSGNAQREAIYVAIKSRVRIVGSAIQNQRPWSTLLDRVQSFVNPAELTDINVDDQGRISISIKTNSLESLGNVAQALIGEAKANQAVNPQLSSFSIGSSGTVQSTFSFLAVF